MAQITITGTVKINSAGPDASSGSTIQFMLTDYMRRSPDNVLIMPAVEVINLTDTTGAFTTTLESTRDAVPSTRYWRVMVRGTFGGKVVNSEIGKIQPWSAPSAQNLYDLLADQLSTADTDRRVEQVVFTGTSGTLSRAASLAAAVRLYRNGIRLRQGVDYTVSGNLQTLTLTLPAVTGDYFEAEYY